MSTTGPKRTKKTKKKKKTAAVPIDLGIEEAWRYVDRFCRALWVKHMQADPSGTLAEMITALRDQGIVPVHEAGMMHTIRTLRNLLVHENVAFGDHETTIAQAAWRIICTWADTHEREAWRLTLTMCDRRAA